ncbi:MAG: hypothetical protein U0Z17_01995 [Bacteroidales bacterium]
MADAKKWGKAKADNLIMRLLYQKKVKKAHAGPSFFIREQKPGFEHRK